VELLPESTDNNEGDAMSRMDGLWLVLLLVLTFLSSSALADEAAWCEALADAPRAASADPGVKRTLEIWERMNKPFNAVFGRSTALTVLSGQARIRDRPLPPNAYLCPGAPATIFVPQSLIDLVAVKKKYPEDFLAFVLGHELGHRFNDLSLDGSTRLKAFARPGRGLEDEELADRIGAFHAAIAGFSPRRLAREETIGAFLTAEAEWRAAQTASRKTNLLQTLETFEAYEELYQTALTLAFADQREIALRLLAWVDEVVQGRGVPLAEVKLARAHVLMMDAAPFAPWMQEARLPVDVSQLRCLPVYAEHTALWEEPKYFGRTRALGPIERARQQLLEARTHVQFAAAAGMDKFSVAAAQSCISFYLSEAADAKRWLAESLNAAPSPLAETVRAAMESNQALTTFLSFLSRHPAPAVEERDAYAKWTRLLAKLKPEAVANPQLLGTFDALARGAGDVSESAPASASTCREKPVARASDLTPMLVDTRRLRGLSDCPTGWKLDLFVSFDGKTDEAGRAPSREYGMAVCVPPDSGGERKLISLRLHDTSSPSYRMVDLRLLQLDNPPGVLGEEAFWRCHCDRMEKRGVSGQGRIAYFGRCWEIGLPGDVVLLADGQRVVQVNVLIE